MTIQTKAEQTKAEQSARAELRAWIEQRIVNADSVSLPVLANDAVARKAERRKWTSMIRGVERHMQQKYGGER